MSTKNRLRPVGRLITDSFTAARRTYFPYLATIGAFAFAAALGVALSFLLQGLSFVAGDSLGLADADPGVLYSVVAWFLPLIIMLILLMFSVPLFLSYAVTITSRALRGEDRQGSFAYARSRYGSVLRALVKTFLFAAVPMIIVVVSFGALFFSAVTGAITGTDIAVPSFAYVGMVVGSVTAAYVFVSLTLVYPIAVLETRRDTIRASFGMVRGRFWALLGRVVLITLITQASVLILQTAAGQIHEVLAVVVQVLTYPIVYAMALAVSVASYHDITGADASEALPPVPPIPSGSDEIGGTGSGSEDGATNT